ncbi:MAG: hypothetical protein ACLP29_11175, partial [Dissulfurispiraceae bacterium]
MSSWICSIRPRIHFVIHLSNQITFFPVCLPPFFQVSLEADVVVVVSEHELGFVAEPRASADIVVVFVVLVPVSAVVGEVDSSVLPKFLAFPNGDHCASSSSSAEVVRKEFVHSSTGVRTNYGLCSILSNLGLHQNKSLAQCYNKPSPGCNKVSDTSDLPRDATTSHSRKTGLHLYRERRKHRSCQAALSHPEVP